MGPYQKVLLAISVFMIMSPPLYGQETEWSFPRAGMKQKTIQGQQAYDLANEFYARFDTINGLRVAIIYLRPDLSALIDNVNREKLGDIPDKAQFMTAVAVNKAIVTNPGQVNSYIEKTQLDGRDIYLYQTRNEAIVGAGLSDDKTFVIVFSVTEGIKKWQDKQAPLSAPTKKPCYEKGLKVPCSR